MRKIIKISQEQMDEYLNNMLNSNEYYQSKIWATIMANNKVILDYVLKYGGAVGALSNTYCYIGLLPNKLNIVTLDKFTAKSQSQYSIKLTDITNLKIKKSIIPGRRLLIFNVGKEKIKVSIMNNAIGTNISNQKENVKALLNNLFDN